MIDYNGKIFKPIENTENGETSNETVFVYKQVGKILTSEVFRRKNKKRTFNWYCGRKWQHRYEIPSSK